MPTAINKGNFSAIEMSEVPTAICGYPLPGWRLDHVQWDVREGQPDGWIVALKRESPDWRTRRSICVMARSDVGPLEAWDEALRIALREDAREAERAKARGEPSRGISSGRNDGGVTPAMIEAGEFRSAIIASLDEEFGRQLDTMPEVWQVGEPDGHRIALEGTFDLAGLSDAIEHLVIADIQARIGLRALEPTPPIADELVGRQFERLELIEEALRNGAANGDDPEGHPLYPQAVGARQILKSSFEHQAAVLAAKDAEIAGLRKALIEVEKRCHSETRQGLLAIVQKALGQ